MATARRSMADGSAGVARASAGGDRPAFLAELGFGGPTVLTWFVVHAAVGPILRQSAALATLHALATFALAGWVALRARPAVALWAASYIVGAELVWRMSRARIPWEAGKYGVIAVVVLAMLRDPQLRRIALLPVLYLLFLLPSAVLTFTHPEVAEPGEVVRFNLSGPVSLALTVLFAARFRFTGRELTVALVAALGPLLAVATITLWSTYTAGPIAFGGDSLSATSGGFGANQVSTVLGLGALLSILLLIAWRPLRRARLALIGVLALFVVQSAMTFSRGGLYGAAGACVVGGFFFLRDRGARRRLMLLAALGFAAAQFVILPRLDGLTSGALSDRFSDTSTTGRWELLVADLRIFGERPVFGVGPGVAAYERHGTGVAVAHTELSRLLAEHGALGLASLSILVLLALHGLRRASSHTLRGAVAALLAWSVLSMGHAGMRLAAHGFVFGLAFAFVRPALGTNAPSSEAEPGSE